MTPHSQTLRKVNCGTKLAEELEESDCQRAGELWTLALTEIEHDMILIVPGRLK